MSKKTHFNPEALRKWREDLGWSRSKLAEGIQPVLQAIRPGAKVDPQKLYRYESGEVTPKPFMIECLATAMKGSRDRLLLSDERPRPLRIAVAPYPDYGFFSFCLSQHFSYKAQNDLKDED